MGLEDLRWDIADQEKAFAKKEASWEQKVSYAQS